MRNLTLYLLVLLPFLVEYRDCATKIERNIGGPATTHICENFDDKEITLACVDHDGIINISEGGSVTWGLEECGNSAEINQKNGAHALQELITHCDGGDSCTFNPNKLFGDPCENTKKCFIITFNCFVYNN